MLTAVDGIPTLNDVQKNAIAWRLHLELFSDLGLNPAQPIALPYPNVPPAVGNATPPTNRP
jgi:hypothetical protein